MGDRCYVEFTCRRADLDRLGAAMGFTPGAPWWNEEDDGPGDGLVEVGVCEANYALYTEREQAAQARIPFFGHHTEGGDYAACGFVSLDGEQVEAQIDRMGALIVQVDRDMNIVSDANRVRRYAAKLRAVEKLFGIKEAA